MNPTVTRLDKDIFTVAPLFSPDSRPTNAAR